jgi:lysozyme
MNKARIIGFVIIIGTAIAIAVGLYTFYFAPRASHIDVDRSRYPVRGIDVSAHNGAIDFERVAADSIDFVVLKASEGETFRDSLFNRNYTAARLAGLKIGAYHFFRFDVEGWRQGVNVAAAVDGMQLDLPIVIDIEEWGNPDNYSTEEIVKQIHAMVDMLSDMGYQTMIYTNKNGYNRFIRFRFKNEPIWVCSFSNPPLDAHWDYWQHSHLSEVDGIEGKVDLNTFNGSREKWLSWLKEHRHNPDLQFIL